MSHGITTKAIYADLPFSLYYCNDCDMACSSQHATFSMLTSVDTYTNCIVLYRIHGWLIFPNVVANCCRATLELHSSKYNGWFSHLGLASKRKERARVTDNFSPHTKVTTWANNYHEHDTTA